MTTVRTRLSDAGRGSAVSGLWLHWLTLLFTALALLQLGLVDNNLRPTTFLPLLVLGLCVLVAVSFFYYRRLAGDSILLPLVFFLSALGLAVITRLAPLFVSRQLIWLAVATGLLLLVTLLSKNLDWLHRYKYTWLIGGLLLLSGTLIFGVNPSGFGARLWLQVGNLFFQPSELLKLLLIVFLAGYLADRRHHLIETKAYIGRLSIPHPSYLGPMLLMWGFSIILLVWQRDLGAALLFFGTFLGMLYMATGQSRYIWGGLLLLVVAGLIGYNLFDVVRLRVEGFLNPWLDPAGRSFQIVQSLLAFASGGIIGQGLGQGLPTAIPVVHTDFVFAAIGEEYGLLGALGVLVCFVLLVSRAFSISLQAQSDFEQLLAAGIGTMLGLQTLVIMAGTLKLMPLTGVTLPFVSYGGSSLIVSFLMIGLLLFIANNSRQNELKNTPREPSTHLIAPQVPYYILHTAAVGRFLLLGFVVIAGGLILWQLVAVPFLLARSDNPRLVVAAQRVERGRLLTRDGIPIAETNMGANGLAQRHYPYPNLSSVTGYYSIRYGTGGTEATFDPILQGTFDQTRQEQALDNLLHRPAAGRDVSLTIDLPAQVAADVALGDREGAVVVMEIDSGAVLVMSSHPTYDPNKLDESWDILSQDEAAPLLNRATQGLFPVGDLARLVGLIGLHEAGATIPANVLGSPLEKLLAPLGPTGYSATANQLGLTRPLTGLRSQSGRLPDFSDKGTVRDLAVTPLHMARVVAALEYGGDLPEPVLAGNSESEQIHGFRADTARRVRGWLLQVDEQTIGFWGTATPEETGQQSLSWFVGLAPAQASPLAPRDSAALSAEDALDGTGLILDPAKIDDSAPAPTALPTVEKAQYVIVVVVATDRPKDQPAIRIARSSLKVLIDIK